MSKEIGNDKAKSARTIAKLMEQGYVYKKQYERNSRAYELYLTEKAKEVMPKIHEEIQKLLNLITEDLSKEEKLITMKSLKKIFDVTQRLKE